jgi:hypothetical protein
MRKYNYILNGTGAGGHTWKAEGTVMAAPGDFLKVPLAATRDAFVQLTQGKAIYGKPGVACLGPYQVKKMVIEEV